jgi:lipopolysaccharide biosynthesis glycosyltransferase
MSSLGAKQQAGAVRRHVIVATDEGFAMPTAVTLRSLVTNGGGPFAITVLHDAISEDSRHRIAASLGDHDVELAWFDISKFDVGATTGTHLSRAAYFRLNMNAALPADARRVLYLDVDVLVRHDLTPLFEMDLDGHVLGAVRSVHFPNLATRGAVWHWRTLDLDPRAAYFNSGVLTIDMDRWREVDISATTLAHLRSPHCGRGADQEALNVALNGNWQPLAPSWNQQTPLLNDDHGVQLIHTDEEIRAARTDPAIVHFQTRPKPWHRGCTHPWQNEWLEVAARTAFAETTEQSQRSPRGELVRRSKRAASALVRGT